jgi:hypothetical protein
MLGLFLIYFIGKNYYELADKFGKSKWGFAILGVFIYYLGTFISGIFFGVLAEAGVTNFFIELPEFALSLFALPFGIAACWGVYKLLSKQWSNQAIENDNGLLDSDLIRNSQQDANQNRNENM